jgi:hypothetical protein
MLFKALSAAVYGIDASIIDVEVDYSGFKTQEARFSTVGLPDAAVRESRDRVRAAIKIPASISRRHTSPSTSLPPTLKRKAPALTSPWPSAFSEPTARCNCAT